MAKKKDVKKKISVKPHTLYNAKEGAVERKRKSCPKCGPGIFLAQHKDRLTCGKCHYMEKISKKPEAPKEEKKEQKEDKKEQSKESKEKKQESKEPEQDKKSSEKSE